MTVSESVPTKVLRVVTSKERSQDYRMRGSLVDFYLVFFPCWKELFYGNLNGIFFNVGNVEKVNL